MTDAISREQAMQNTYSGYFDYGSHIANREAVGFQEGIKELAMMTGLAVGGIVVLPALASAVSYVAGSAAYKAFRVGYGFYKRPVISTMVSRGIRGGQTLMGISKAYSGIMLGLGLADYKRNIDLARSGQYTKLGINIFGPPGSLFAYNSYMSRNKTVEEARVAFDQVAVDSSLTSMSKTGGTSSSKKYSKGSGVSKYRPKAGKRCRKGYRKIGGMCVKR